MPPSSFCSLAIHPAASVASADGTASFPIQMCGPAPASLVTTSGSVSPVLPYPTLAAMLAAAAFSASDDLAGTITLPAMKSAMPSLLVSTSIHPVANGSAMCDPV